MSRPNTLQTGPSPNRLARRWLLAGGWLLFALGLIGILLPVMPTTVFWIGAVWCWSRSAPHLTRRVLAHPRFGEPVQLFLERGEMTRQGKRFALAGMALGYALLHLLGHPDWWVSLPVGLCLILVAAWLWIRPEPAHNLSPHDSLGGEPLRQLRKLKEQALD